MLLTLLFQMQPFKATETFREFPKVAPVTMQKSFGMKLSRLILILLILTSCNAEKKLQRLVKKNPELLKADTITIQDTLTVITNKVQTDTVS